MIKKQGKNIKCDECGKEKYFIPFHAKTWKKHFCGRVCKIKHAKRISGYPKLIGQCAYCQMDIVAKASNFDKPWRKYCSQSCRTISNNKKMIPSDRQREWARELGKKMKYRKISNETRIKNREANLGNKSHFWKGGLTSENTKLRNSVFSRNWRKAVYERDNYTCQKCGLRSKKGKSVILNADHIKPWSLFPELRFNINNGRTLCIDCHRNTETFGSRTSIVRQKIIV